MLARAHITISATAQMNLSCVVQERDAGLNVRETVDCVYREKKRTEEVVWTLCVCIGQRRLCGHCVCV